MDIDPHTGSWRSCLWFIVLALLLSTCIFCAYGAIGIS